MIEVLVNMSRFRMFAFAGDFIVTCKAALTHYLEFDPSEIKISFQQLDNNLVILIISDEGLDAEQEDHIRRLMRTDLTKLGVGPGVKIQFDYTGYARVNISCPELMGRWSDSMHDEIYGIVLEDLNLVIPKVKMDFTRSEQPVVRIQVNVWGREIEQLLDLRSALEDRVQYLIDESDPDGCNLIGSDVRVLNQGELIKD